jgi:hypothetical protein
VYIKHAASFGMHGVGHSQVPLHLDLGATHVLAVDHSLGRDVVNLESSRALGGRQNGNMGFYRLALAVQ